MMNRSLKNKILIQVSTTAVLIALIALSIIQYHWVTSSAEKDITELYRSFNYSIFSKISEEFSMFPLLGGRLDFFDEVKNEKKLKEVIVDLFIKFKSAQNYDYINSISYIINSENSKYISYSESGWQKKEIISNEFISEKWELFLLPDSADNGKVWINLPVKLNDEGTKVFILFHFDIFSFYKNEVEQSLTSLGDNYELKWNYDFTGEIEKPNEKEYNYSPFAVIKNKLFSTEKPWLIEIPLHVILFNDEKNRKSKIYFDPRRPRLDKKPPPTVYIDIYYNGKPLIQSKEYTLTIQWVLSLLLLTGIGVTYVIILFQIGRLKQLRYREKEFVASVTHELRTPLTVIHSAADNIKSGIISPERIEQYGHLITDQSSRLSSMIEGILLFSKLEGKVEQSPQLNNIRISDIHKELQIFTQSLNGEIRDNIHMDFGSLPGYILSDRDTIELILTNLITNSSKHAYAQQEMGEIRVTGHIKLPHTLIFIVEDDGCGIERAEKRHIFDPFFRGGRSHMNQIKGSGLGLYLSYKKARLLGGSVKFESPYERADSKKRSGCRFTLKIPYIPADPEVEDGQSTNN